VVATTLKDLERASVTADFWPGHFTYGDKLDKQHWLVHFEASKISWIRFVRT